MLSIRILVSSGTEIYYSELLFALEALAWDEQYLFDTTDILMYLCSYRNDSNYANKPINTLLSIYRFGLPQTYAPFETRLEILKSCATKHPKNHIITMCIAAKRTLRTSFYAKCTF